MYEHNVVGRLGIVKGGTKPIELCVNERTVRRTSIPESQGDEPGRGGIDPEWRKGCYSGLGR